MRHPRTAFALVVLLAVGCASNPAPEGFLVPAAQEIYDTRGAWIQLEFSGGVDGRLEVEGELLATDTDSVHVLVPRGGDTLEGEVLSYPWGRVSWWRARAYDPSTGQYAGLTAAGALSTISHGWFLALSAPIWILSGSLITGAESKRADYGAGNSAGELSPWARFPQGLPPTLDRAGLSFRFDPQQKELPPRFRRPVRDWSEY